MEAFGQLHAPAALPKKKSPQYLMDRKLGGLRKQSGRSGEEKNSFHCPCRESNAGRPAHSLVSILTELPWLLSEPDWRSMNSFYHYYGSVPGGWL
jgi:hypothetical protein